MKKSDFRITEDSSGERYVTMRDFLTKNHRGDVVNDISQQGRMYQCVGSDRCPVMSFEKYISKLNSSCEWFWQQPNRQFASSSSVWYINVPLGVNTLQNKMRTLSTQAELSKIYTNHCLRATCITALDHSNIEEARHIMA